MSSTAGRKTKRDSKYSTQLASNSVGKLNRWIIEEEKHKRVESSVNMKLLCVTQSKSTVFVLWLSKILLSTESED